MYIVLKRRTSVADVSAHDEVQNSNVIVTIFIFYLKDLFMRHVPTGGGGRVLGGEGDIFKI